MKPRACIVVASEMTVRAFLVRQVTAMAEHYDVTVVVNTRRAEFLARLGIPATLHRLPIARAASPLQDLSCLIQLTGFLRAGRFDVVHSMTPKAGLLAMLAARIAGVPVRLHTFTGQVWATRRGLARAGLRLLDRVMAAAATLTLADSPSQRAFLIAAGVVPPSKIRVLGCGSVSGVDTERFRPDPQRRQHTRARLGIPPGDVVLLFLGRLTRDKGVLDLARAYAVLAGKRTDLRLIVAGPDEEGLSDVLRAACGEYAQGLHLCGFATAPEELMAAADILCLPSYREGFGSVIIEAAAAGVPAVASRIYGVVDAVVEEETGLLHEAGDVQALVEQLHRLIGDSSLRQRLAAAARLRAVRGFSQQDVAAALLDTYARLVAGTRRIGRLRAAAAPGRHAPSVRLACDSEGLGR